MSHFSGRLSLVERPPSSSTPRATAAVMKRSQYRRASNTDLSLLDVRYGGFSDPRRREFSGNAFRCAHSGEPAMGGDRVTRAACRLSECVTARSTSPRGVRRGLGIPSARAIREDRCSSMSVG